MRQFEFEPIGALISVRMSENASQVAVLGSTGSIGRNTLDVISASQGKLSAIALSAHTNCRLLSEQAARHAPRWIVAADEESARGFDWAGLPKGIQVLRGQDSLDDIASRPEVDVVLCGIVGGSGLRSTWAAVESGKRIALANKETLVMAGPLVAKRALETGAQILPVDSEHSAIFQSMQAGRRDEVSRVVLTASGGPFRTYSEEQLAQVTVEDALAHPTWEMGKKITIDSATLMNKALEIIEARWLFGLDVDQIGVVIHPQSVVHSFVEFVDGAVIAQMGPPDMRLPIQYALNYPRRLPGVARKMNWEQSHCLEFESPDFDRYPALKLGLDVARAGGTSGAVLNAANELAVEKFLVGEIEFRDIVPACRSVLEHHHFNPSPTLDEVFAVDRWARQEILRWACT